MINSAASNVLLIPNRFTRERFIFTLPRPVVAVGTFAAPCCRSGRGLSDFFILLIRIVRRHRFFITHTPSPKADGRTPFWEVVATAPPCDEQLEFSPGSVSWLLDRVCATDGRRSRVPRDASLCRKKGWPGVAACDMWWDCTLFIRWDSSTGERRHRPGERQAAVWPPR